VLIRGDANHYCPASAAISEGVPGLNRLPRQIAALLAKHRNRERKKQKSDAHCFGTASVSDRMAIFSRLPG